MQVEFVRKLDIACRLVSETVPVKPAHGLDHAFGALSLAGHHQRRQRVQGVEQEVGVDLITQRPQFRSLGRRSELLFAPFGRPCLIPGEEREIGRCPGKQQKVAAQSNIDHAAPRILAHGGGGNDEGFRDGRDSLGSGCFYLHPIGEVIEKIAFIIETKAAFFGIFLLELRLNIFEGELVYLPDCHRDRNRKQACRADLHPQRLPIDQPQQRP